MYLSFKHQILLVTEEGTDGIAKIAFNELTLAKELQPISITDRLYNDA